MRKKELKLQELQEEYKEKDQIGIPMSVRERYWNRMDELKEKVREKAHEKKLGQVLLEKKLVENEDLQRALTDQAESREDKLIGEVLLEKGLITEKQLREAIRDQVGNESLERSKKVQ